ncbi:MAG: 1,4-dihydroxy-6-naphthoate synthase [Sphingobacteriales bacterium]|nr:MAG: 1,4-dihydroxy-6-naphthoate synthase [Sphingobacteriales bacterium]
MKLTIGFSPCPNDTFIFDAMLHGKVDTEGLQFDLVLEDVETLNLWAMENRLDITKLSYSCFLRVVDDYALLHSGSALGQGVGPLLVAKDPQKANLQDPAWRSQAKIAIPGINTTANLLLSLAYPDLTARTEVLFSEIENEVLAGKFDAGLVIHESRFTYMSRGLHKLADLGDWWEHTMNAAIPLGGIVVRRSLGGALSAKIDRVIARSLAYAWEHYPALPPFVTANAQEMDEDVMRAHINLYVNEYTAALGEKGTASIHKLFKKAAATGIISNTQPVSIFY